MSKFFDANSKITNMVTSNGDIVKLEINGKDVSLGSDLENNKTATINVSTYTQPVEITPSSGKDGMKKATITLSNIPSAGDTLYAWKDTSDSIRYLSVGVAPADETAYQDVKTIQDDGYGGLEIISMYSEGSSNYVRISDTSFSDIGQHATTYTRDSTNDLVLWQTS